MDGVLTTRIYKDTKTIALMDEFEQLDETYKKIYTELILDDVFCVKYRCKLYWVSLILERKPKSTKCISSGLTFTDFKRIFCENVFSLTNKGSNSLSKICIEGIQKSFSPESIITKYIFPTPIQFSAQNSANRSGYGNRYCGEELIYEGTLYGETTEYMFTEARYKRW